MKTRVLLFLIFAINSVYAETLPVPYSYTAKQQSLADSAVATPVIEQEQSTEQDPIKLPMPSVKNILVTEQVKNDARVIECIGNDENLLEVYQKPEIKEFVEKHLSREPCDKLTKELQNAYSAHKAILKLKDNKICQLDSIDLTELTQEEVDVRKARIEMEYNAVATMYTKYFTYNEDIATIEMCMNYYDSFAVTQEIYSNFATLAQNVEDKRAVVTDRGLYGFYGEDRGMVGIGIVPMIEDILSKKVTVSQVSSYAIFEQDPTRWVLKGADNFNLVYSNGQYLVAIPFLPGISYSCNSLPYDLFVLEKKIEFQKYSIFMLTPLE